MSEFVTATVSAGGRIRIPAKVLAALNLKDGDSIAFRIDSKDVRLARIDMVVK